jgi:hypothetical protein
MAHVLRCYKLQKMERFLLTEGTVLDNVGHINDCLSLAAERRTPHSTYYLMTYPAEPRSEGVVDRYSCSSNVL